MRRFLPPVALALLAACGGAPENESVPATNGPTAQTGPAQANASAPAPAGNLSAWLPVPGAHRAQAVTITAPPEMEALAARISAGIRANPDWHRAYAAQHPTGELPWHPNLGVSEAEYRRFFALSRQLSLREVDRVSLTATRRPDGGLALSATGAAAPLNGITVYPDRAETPLGSLADRAAVNNREAASPTGPWQGVQWTSRGRAGRPIQLAFGRRARGDMILYYDFGPSDAETVTLLYPAPQR